MLDSRRLLSGTTLSGGVLVVEGRSLSDNISVFVESANHNKIDVKVNKVVQSFDASAVTSIQVHGFAGEDAIDVSLVSVPTTLYGDGGNDTIIGGGGKDRIYGGDGNDSASGG